MQHTLSYSKSGNPNGKALIAFHGVTDCGASLHDLAIQFGRHYEIYLCDHLGHGLSPRLSHDELEDPFQALYAAGLRTVIDIYKENPAREIILYGHSLGGAVASHIAHKAPAMFTALILEDPALLTPAQEKIYANEAANLYATQIRVREHVPNALTLLQESYPNWPTTETIGWAQGKTEVDLNFISTGIVGTTNRDILSSLSIPTLLVSGDAEDVLFSETDFQELKEQKNPYLQLQRIPQASHTVRRDNPEEFYTLMKNFLDSLPEKNNSSPYIADDLHNILDTTVEQTPWNPKLMRENGKNIFHKENSENSDCTISEDKSSSYRLISNNQGTPDRIIFSIHGGGFVAGEPDFDDARHIDLLRALEKINKVNIYSPYYRLCPEATYLDSISDCYSALENIAEKHPNVPITILGDSAGATLALLLLSQLNHNIDISSAASLMDKTIFKQIDTLILLEPVLDPFLQSKSFINYKNGPVWTVEAASSSWNQTISAHPDKTKLSTEDIAVALTLLPKQISLPPMMVVVNSADPLRDEGIKFSTACADLGHNVSLHMLSGSFHGSGYELESNSWRNTKDLITNFIKSNN